MNFTPTQRFFGRTTLITVGAIIVFEILSFLGFLIPEINTAAFLFLTVATFLLAVHTLEYGVLIMFAELVIGSKGYLFSETIFGFDLSIRLAIFLVVFLAFLINAIRTRKIQFFRLPYWRWFAAVIVVFAFGTVNGILSGNENNHIFRDLNGYLFLGFLPIFLQAIRDDKQLRRVFHVITAGLLTMGAKTIIVLFLFSHNFLAFLPVIYRWIRVTGVGEITEMDWNFYRIFFQSQIIDLIFVFVLLVIILLQWNKERIGAFIKNGGARRSRGLFILLFVVFLTTLVSWSRSFWMGMFATGLLLTLWLIVVEKYRIKELGVYLSGLGILFVLTTAALSGILNIPIDGSSWGDASIFSLAADRASDVREEPAAASRFILLRPLTSKILERPFIGTGYGTTVTYQTQDARALANNPDGKYTTFTFEWGYLDIMTEIGLLGLIVLLWFGRQVFRQGHVLAQKLDGEKQALVYGLLFGLFALAVVHTVTPYLNHPLGLQYIILCIGVFQIFSHERHAESK